jgi:hypothetical protein
MQLGASSSVSQNTTSISTILFSCSVVSSWAQFFFLQEVTNLIPICPYVFLQISHCLRFRNHPNAFCSINLRSNFIFFRIYASHLHLPLCFYKTLSVYVLDLMIALSICFAKRLHINIVKMLIAPRLCRLHQ